MLNLFENYLEKEEDLLSSLKAAGYTHQTVVLKDEGYLPKEIISPVNYFTQMNVLFEGQSAQPLFFNEVSVPYYWEIKGDGQKAEIFDGYKLKGLIRYSNRRGDYRAVKSVEWLNEQEKVRSIDLYNQYGVLFGKENYSDGQLTLSTYFNAKGQEVLLFNHVAGTIQVHHGGKQFIFGSYYDFMCFFFEVAGLNTTELFYNSLGNPYFISLALKKRNPKKDYNHALFWQETSSVIPGNMLSILKDASSPTHRILVQDIEEYKRLVGQVPHDRQVKLTYLGYIYDLKSRQRVEKTLLIMTNSDQIAHLDELVEALPRFQFHIAARTTMSERLLAYEHYPNVSLHPTIEEEEVAQLITQSSIYLDINHGNEVEHIIRKSFDGSQLIFGFSNTVHNRRYVSPENIVSPDQVSTLIALLKSTTQNKAHYLKALQQQERHGGQSSIKEYKDVLK